LQGDHYGIAMSKRALAVECGAKEIMMSRRSYGYRDVRRLARLGLATTVKTNVIGR
jgi:hypothetical protein